MNQLALFAKFWEPGKVKTRLGRSIGNDSACRLYFEFLQTLLARPYDEAIHKRLFFSPAEREEQFSKLVAAEGWELQVQAIGDLGDRLEHAVRLAFEGEVSALVVIGSDSPNMPISHVEQAFDELKTHDIVLGPTHDGGYYLIGLKRPHPEVFRGIPWSSDSVYSATVAQIERLGLSWTSLPAWYDVDELESLKKLHRDLVADVTLHPSLSSLRQLVTEVIDALPGE